MNDETNENQFEYALLDENGNILAMASMDIRLGDVFLDAISTPDRKVVRLEDTDEEN